MAGRQRLVPALREAKSSLKLSTYATRDKVPERYFQNRFGGLGQYYVGTLQDLQILDLGTPGWIRYTEEHGLPLAKSVDQQVDGDRFFQAINDDRVSLNQLDKLSSFCFCQLANGGAERDRLADLMLRPPASDHSGRQRRLSLAAALSMIDESSKFAPSLATASSFQASVYCRSVANGIEWKIPSCLESTVQTWALYVRNELLSVAAQAVFAVALKRMAAAPVTFRDSTEFSSWFQKTDLVRGVARRFRNATFGQVQKEISKQLAPITQSDSEQHEWSLAREVQHQYDDSGDTDADVLEAAARLLATLAARTSASDAYALSPFTREYLDHYPINLQSHFAHSTSTWVTQPITELLGWLAGTWGIETHLWIAMRKLRSGQSTFRVRPTDSGLEVQEGIPRPTATNPRMGQGLRILRDLGAIRDVEDSSHLTDFGRDLLEEVIHAP